MSPPGRRRRQLRLGTEVVGPKGVLLLVLGAVLAAILAVVGTHDQHFAGLSSSLAAPSGSSGASQGPGGPTPASAPATTTPTTAPPHPTTTAPSSSSPSSSPPATAKLGPALSSTPYASVAFQVYPGTPSAATRQALAGFQVSVARHGTSIEVKVSVSGSSQP
ncbi:MAG: hypothetical protein ACRD0L_09525, partial [Acidimicrobiales bacterium]